MPPPAIADDDEIASQVTVLHQETLKLVGVVVIAVAAFFATRAVAANNRAARTRDAAEWFARGERALAEQRPADAVDSFRHASTMKRDDREYALALARALTATDQNEAAERTLLTWRETAPDDPDVNLELARLDAKLGAIADARRYYRNALYAPWPPERTDARRDVRWELIRFLITTGQSAQAESELVALANDLPPTRDAHVAAGDLFVKVGDQRRALEQFDRALAVAPGDRDALTGAARAAFALGNYEAAQRYLHRLPDPAVDLVETRETVDAVLSGDPLAARIGAAERRRRLLEGLSYVNERLLACSSARPADASMPLAHFADEAAKLSAQFARSKTLENDDVEHALDLVNQAEQAVVRACAPAQTKDRALLLIAARHAASAS